ncbi:MAG: hypothetical protein WB791_08060, partial [Waddliaceae bacterium]
QQKGELEKNLKHFLEHSRTTHFGPHLDHYSTKDHHKTQIFTIVGQGASAIMGERFFRGGM